MFTTTEQNMLKRHAILKTFSSMREGQTMTYADLSSRAGHPVTDNSDAQFRWAMKHAPDKGIVIRHVWGTKEFKRLSKVEIAADNMRAKRIKTQANAGFDEVSVAMASNDKNVQAVASAKAARFSLIRDTTPTSNKKLVSNKL